ncbi:MAG: hypothetical protein WED82_03670 [Balneolales bacterium]
MTQEDLSRRAGVGLRFVRDLEQGKESLRLDNDFTSFGKSIGLNNTGYYVRWFYSFYGNV